MAARKKVTKSRSTKKTARISAAPKRTKAKVKAKPRAKAKAVARAKPIKNVAGAGKKKQARTAKKSIAAKPASRELVRTTATKARAKPASKGAITRRDATGHLNPKYAADLRARSHESAEDLGNDNKFLRRSRAHDTLAEELGEDAVKTMTSGEDQSDRMQDLEVEEETGGPFVRTSGREEYAGGTDKSNPLDATREPFPTT